ncbi:MAG: C-type lectin domain-containing protein [Oligoflexales bacterium]
MKKIIILLAIVACFGCKPRGSRVKADPDEVRELGYGFESISNKFKVAPCVDRSKTHIDPHARSSLSYKRDMEMSEFQQIIGAGFGTDLTLFKSAGAFTNRQGSAATSTNYTFYIQLLAAREYLDDTNPLGLTGEAKKESITFRQNCGDYFLKTIFYGALLMAQVRIDFENKIAKNDFDSKFDLRLGAAGVDLVGINGGGEFGNSDAGKNAKITFFAEQVGGDGGKLVAALEAGSTTGTSTQTPGASTQTTDTSTEMQCNSGNFEMCLAGVSNVIKYAKNEFAKDVGFLPFSNFGSTFEITHNGAYNIDNNLSPVYTAPQLASFITCVLPPPATPAGTPGTPAAVPPATPTALADPVACVPPLVPAIGCAPPRVPAVPCIPPVPEPAPAPAATATTTPVTNLADPALPVTPTACDADPNQADCITNKLAPSFYQPGGPEAFIAKLVPVKYEIIPYKDSGYQDSIKYTGVYRKDGTEVDDWALSDLFVDLNAKKAEEEKNKENATKYLEVLKDPAMAAALEGVKTAADANLTYLNRLLQEKCEIEIAECPTQYEISKSRLKPYDLTKLHEAKDLVEKLEPGEGIGGENTFANWAVGEPNNKGPLWALDEDCAAANPSGKWNDQSCTIKLPFACKSKSGTWYIDNHGLGEWKLNSQFCSGGGKFAKPNSAEDNQALTEALKKASKTSAWINFSDTEIEGYWESVE